MKICITAQGKDLETQVDPKFGRCAFFIIVDTETMKFEAIDNSGINSAGGAGIQAGQLASEKDVKAVLTGNVGPNAFQTLKAANIDIYTGVTGKIENVIMKYKKGELQAVSSASVDSHFGMQGEK